MSELKRCPFCGGEAELFRDDFGKIGVHCDDCDLWMGVSLEDGVELMEGWRAVFANEEQAIAAWNRRTPDTGNPVTENAPLSIEELRGMDGEPVWIESKGFDGYAIILKTIGLSTDYVQSNGKVKFRHANGYGKTWLAYRQKPESKEEVE